jgi:hypothetical protein
MAKKRETLKFKKGDKVVMHTCMEAYGREDKVWTCVCDSYERCGSEVVFLEGYSGAFATEFLKLAE